MTPLPSAETRRQSRSGVHALLAALMPAVLASPGTVLAVDPATASAEINDPEVPSLVAAPGTDAWVTDQLLIGLRAGPDTTQPLLGVIGSGALLHATQREGDWVQVDSEHGAGWVHGAYLTTTPPAAQRALALEQRIHTLESDLDVVRQRAQGLAMRSRDGQHPPRAPTLIAGLLVGLALFLSGAAAAANWISRRRG